MDAVKWWRQHRYSPGMDGASKRALLQVMQQEKLRDFDRITDGMNADQRALWDEVFADDYAELCRAIGEVEAALSGAKTPGELAYEEDVRRCPLHHDGSPRRAWSEISDVARWSWERDPRPREFKHLKGVAR